jgi:hypothetical protein
MLEPPRNRFYFGYVCAFEAWRFHINLICLLLRGKIIIHVPEVFHNSIGFAQQSLWV